MTPEESKDVFNLMLTTKQRYKILMNMDTNLQYENVKRLMDIYRLSSIKKLEKFFIHICIFDVKINLYLKQELLYILSCKVTTKNRNDVRRSFSNVLFLMVSKALELDEYWYMMEEFLILYNSTFKELTLHNFLKNIIIVGLKKLKCKEPINRIFSLLTRFKTEIFFMDLCVFIFDNYKTKLTVKNNLFLLQILFEQENRFKDVLFHMIDDNSLELNYKLEACDILYLKGSEKIKNMVEKSMLNLLPDISYTNNPENVHLFSMAESVDRTIESMLVINKGVELPLNLHKTLLDTFPKDERIKGSLNRIFTYNFLRFSKYNLTLKEILENIWLIITNKDNFDLKTQLCLRLEQELVEMYNTCSRGYVTRLINVFSGFQIDRVLKLGITISYEDEIYSIFSSKVNNMVAQAPDTLKEILLEELMVPSDDYEKRLNLTKYLRPYIPKIWNEIFDMFKDELTITDLDLYCRKVMMKYDGCL